MRAGQVQLRLPATNTWWRSPDWRRDDPDLRAASDAPFTYRSGVLKDLAPGGLYVLRGPRRVGKSTEIKHAISDLLASGTPPRNIVHAAVDGWRPRTSEGSSQAHRGPSSPASPGAAGNGWVIPAPILAIVLGG